MGSAIFAPLFLVVLAAAAAIITVFVIAAVVSPSIVVFGGALRVGIFFVDYRFLLLVPS